MSGSKVAAFVVMDAAVAQLDKAVELLRAVTADTEPVPHQAVLLRNVSSGERHRAFVVDGMTGYWTREECQIDDIGEFRVVPNLADVVETSDMCGHCLPLDLSNHDVADVETDEVPG